MAKRNIVVVLNGISLRKKYFYNKVLPALRAVAEIEVRETLTKNDAVNLASRAADKFVDAIIAAGGDGTLNQVVNGVLAGRETAIKLPAIGIVPLGSGNDFARSADITGDIQQMTKLIKTFEPRKIDVGQIHFTRINGGIDSRYFVNMADMGMGPVVVDKVMKSTRPFGHAVAYYQSILSTFLEYRPMEIEAKTRDWYWKGKLRTLGVGNGKYYGHGLGITPDAILNDRLLHVFICGDVSVLDFVRYTGNLKKAKHIQHSEVHYKTATEISFSSERECLIEGDGESLGKLPATIRLVERQLDFLI